MDVVKLTLYKDNKETEQVTIYMKHVDKDQTQATFTWNPKKPMSIQYLINNINKMLNIIRNETLNKETKND